MKLRNLLFLILLLAFTIPSWGQKNPKVTELYQQAEMALLKGDAKKAIRNFKKVLKENPDLAAAHRGLGLSYEMLNEFNEAIYHYEEVLSMDSLFSRALYYQVGELYYKTSEFETALDYFEKYQSLQDTSDQRFKVYTEQQFNDFEREEEIDQKLNASIRAANISIDQPKFQQIDTIENLGSAINTDAREVFPYLTNDQAILYFTRQNKRTQDEDLFFSLAQGDGWIRSSTISGNFNTKHSEGMSTLVRDGKIIFFTACGREYVMGACDIWEGELERTTIKNIKPLEGYANSEFWESQASISCDGETLFFASKRKGGLGGTDIWMSKKDRDGHWNDPVNLGPNINTNLDEEAPFITTDGQALYFSSTGHLGMGEQDIFVSYLDADGNWSESKNLGPPINTPYREFGFFLSADNSTGYFSSDRPGGFGAEDIYRFKLTEELSSTPITFVEGYVTDSTTNEPIETTVGILNHVSVKTSPDGRFFLCVPGGDTLNLGVTEKGYLPYTRSFEIPEWDNKRFYTLEVKLKDVNALTIKSPEPLKDTTKIEPAPIIRQRKSYNHQVFFQFDSDKIIPDQLDDLNEFVGGVFNKEIIRIEIVGFADDVGQDRYNLELSEQRAKAIGLYMIERGMSPDNIHLEGRGELKNNQPKKENRKVTLRIYTLE
ncbi:MAG: OmpA family protein [Bacteroidota bacterium]